MLARAARTASSGDRCARLGTTSAVLAGKADGVLLAGFHELAAAAREYEHHAREGELADARAQVAQHSCTTSSGALREVN
ncbi:MAG: hypothetical protein ACRDQ5_16375 [Sciscionella sp.]